MFDRLNSLAGPDTEINLHYYYYSTWGGTLKRKAVDTQVTFSASGASIEEVVEKLLRDFDRAAWRGLPELQLAIEHTSEDEA